MKHLIVLSCLLSLLACVEEESDKDTLNGPCVVEYQDSVVKIESAISGTSSEDIQAVVISEITLNEVDVDLRYLNEESKENVVFDFEANAVTCNIPCGFSSLEGNYNFKVSAEGYQSEMLNIDASYSVFDGGCPARYNVGAEIDIVLTEVN